MKIVQAVGWYFPDSLGGTEVYVAALAERLAAAGHEVSIAAPQPGQAASGAAEPGRGPRTYEHAGIPVFRYPVPARPSREEAQGRCRVRGTEHLDRRLADEAPDVVHFHTFVPGLGVDEVEAARRGGARTVVTTHSSSLGYVCQRGTLLRWGREPCDAVPETSPCAACALEGRGLPRPLARAVGALPTPLSRALAALPGSPGTALGMRDLIAHNRRRQERLARAVDRFVVLTDWARRAVEANGFPPGKLEVNRLGSAHASLHAKPGPDATPTSTPLTVGYLGRFEAVKGPEDLALAVASLPPEVLVRLVLRGPAPGPGERAVLARIEELARSDARISVAPPVPYDEVPALLAGWDLLACPARCAEGGPTVAIEAHGVGTPVIGSALGGPAELIRDGVDGRLFPPGDVAALAAILREAAGDPAGTVDRWRRSLPPARTMDEVAADYLSLYDRITSGDNPGAGAGGVG